MAGSKRRTSIADHVHRRVLRGGDRLWRAADFPSESPAAVAQALSRLEKRGEIRRVAKGVYHRPGRWLLGETKPLRSAVVAASVRSTLTPAGLTAANALGLTTQNPARPEMAVSGAKTPTLLRDRAHVKTGRPIARRTLSNREAAVLEVLRDHASTSDLEPHETMARLVEVIRAEGTFARLAKAAAEEPPRVRAMLGALGDAIDASLAVREQLRASLNPLSRFNFGPLVELPTARRWQAKGRR